jgi:phage terminase large subunit-like protein
MTPEYIEKEYYKRTLFYKPNKKQFLFHAAGIDAQERLLTGGNRSGKTFAGLIEVKNHITGIYNEDWNGYKFDRPIRVWVCGKTSKVVIESLQKDLLGDTEQNLRGILHADLISRKPKKAGSSEMYSTVYVSHSSGGSSKVTFKTYEEGWEAFQSSKVDLILLDEEPPLRIYQECKMRTMSTNDGFRGMIMVCSTPLKGYSDFFNYFMDDRYPEQVKDSIWHAHIEWDDTEHLPETEKKRLLALMSPHEIEARTKGIPWPGSGLVYPIPESMLICDPFEIPDHWYRCSGLDFGWTHPTAVLFAAHDRDNDMLYFYAEYSVSERTPDKHCYALQPFGISWIPGVYDPSGKKSTQQGDGKTLVGLFREGGFKNLTPADNTVEKGILKLLQRFQAGKAKIFSTCIKFRSEIRKYARDEDGIPNKENDDLCDCARYIEMSGLPVAIPKNFMNSQYKGRYGSRSVSYY